MAQAVINERLIDIRPAALCQSLLSFLRDDLGLKGSKEGCASGDCGACTVVVADKAGGVHTLNSCITPVGAVAGSRVLTVEGAGTPDDLHPMQQALVEANGSQCGFCTPGFVMAMIGDGLKQRSAGLEPRRDREEGVVALSGNLCRCTGYRPIVSAFCAAEGEPGCEWMLAAGDDIAGADGPYAAPHDLVALRGRLAGQDPAELLIAAGTTDAWLEVSQQYRDFPTIVDVTKVNELKRLDVADGRITIGAAVSHARLLEFFSTEAHASDAIVDILARFGSPQIRSRGTIGGNIANASPIADWPPLLLALDADLDVMSFDGAHRRMALSNFHRGYRTTALRPDELIVSIEFAIPDWRRLAAYKISKRREDDISTVMGVVYAETNDDDVVTTARVAFGGVAATPVRLAVVEEALAGVSMRTLTDDAIDGIAALAAGAVEPISDVRASADYRRAMTGAVVRKCLHKLRDGESMDLWQDSFDDE